MTTVRTPNFLSKSGAAFVLSRKDNEIQITIVCGTAQEAEGVHDRIISDIRTRGQSTMVICGAVDEQASSAKMT